MVEHPKLLLQVLLRNLGVYRRGLHISVPQVLLHGPKVAVGAAQELGAARVPERVGVEFRDPHALTHVLDDFPDALTTHTPRGEFVACRSKRDHKERFGWGRSRSVSPKVLIEDGSAGAGRGMEASWPPLPKTRHRPN